MADPVLKPLSPPGDTKLPDTAQKLLNFVAAYLRLDGLSGLQGVLISDTEPATTDRDKAWIKVDVSSGRAIGLYRYNGGWQQVPVVVASGENQPANPKQGELFYNTEDETLKAFIRGGWTNEFWQSGPKAERPTGVPVGYIYFDTEISRLLRWTSEGWTTLDGAVGDLKMVADATIDEAEARNPGWAVYTAMGGRFPVGYDGDEFSVGEEGGRAKVDWSAKSNAAQGGGRDQGCLTEISIDGTALTAGTGTTTTTKTGEISILPPFRTVIFLRKQF